MYSPEALASLLAACTIGLSPLQIPHESIARRSLSLKQDTSISQSQAISGMLVLAYRDERGPSVVLIQLISSDRLESTLTGAGVVLAGAAAWELARHSVLDPLVFVTMMGSAGIGVVMAVVHRVASVPFEQQVADYLDLKKKETGTSSPSDQQTILALIHAMSQFYMARLEPGWFTQTTLPKWLLDFCYDFSRETISWRPKNKSLSEKIQ